MKTIQFLFFPALILFSVLGFQLAATPLGTAFTYQGRLGSGGNPASGIYDLRFGIYDDAVTGAQIGATLTNAATVVSNGLFTVALDFGSVFDGNARWLELGVRTNGSGGFTVLGPRQPLTASPFALYAPSAGTATLASNLPSGTITAAMIADGAVTSGKIAPAAVKPSNIDDGGSAGYESLVMSARSFLTTEALPFEALLPVATNGGAPGLVFALDGFAFGTAAGFVGHEGISQPYEFVAQVIAPSASLDPNAQLGRVGSILFTRAGRSTTFAGLVTGCSVAAYDGTSVLYTFQIGSSLNVMALNQGYRIYQSKTVPDILASNYLDITGVALTPALFGSYSQREFVMQYAETHLNFVSRLMEQEGIFYFFNQAANPPVLTLGDSAQSLLVAPYEALRYYGDFATNIPAGAEFVRSFQKAKHQSTKRSTQASYDFKKPKVGLLAANQTADGIGENYRYGTALTDLADLETRAWVQAERQQTGHNTYLADGNAADLRPGYTFTLLDQSGAGVSGSYLVTAARQAAFRRVTNGVASFYFGNQCEVLPAALPYRPAVQTPKPSAQPCTAVVVGPIGEEIYVDKYGRVKVQFRWDRYGTNSENSSGWIRVASLWAGKQWGAIFLPRIGQEVIVDFLEGDPDQPVISGSLYNADQMPPYELPANKTISGIKTRSSLSGLPANFNELRFEDKRGSEEIYLHGEKDLNISTENNATFIATNNATLGAGGDLNLSGQAIQFSSLQGIGIGTTHDPAFALNAAGTIAATAFQGDGSALANLSATALTSGTLSDSLLSGNVALRNGGNSFSGSQVISGGNLRLSDQPIYLRGGADTFHGLAWYANGTFAGANPDGPVLFGCGGGALGSMCGSQKLALTWNDSGNVTIDPGSQNNGTLIPGLTFAPNSGEGIASKRTVGGNQFGLDFYTFGTNRLSIANGGNVGIGTSSPARRLHVLDADGIGGSLQVGSQLAGATPKLINFGDADYVHIGENGQDDRMELKASSFFFTAGNVGIGTNIPQQKLHVVGGVLFTSGSSAANQSVAWLPGGASWSFTSDRNAKEHIAPVSPQSVLDKVCGLPIAEWNYLGYEQRHIGPMAQDFHAAFPLNPNDTSLNDADLHGVALAAIQGLNQKLERKETEITELKRRLERLEQLIVANNGGGK